MIFALLTAVCYPLSAICGKQLTGAYGSQRANLYRLILATLVLGVITLTFFPGSFHPTTFSWLFVSGIVGFGLGDVALFYAYQCIGSRLTVLLNFSLATIFGVATEFLWLGTTIRLVEICAIAVILTGLSVAVLSIPPSHVARSGSYKAGILAAVIAGLGQGVGTVISRHAGFLSNELGMQPISGISQAFQRVTAGLLFAIVVVAILHFKSARSKLDRPPVHRTVSKRLPFWLIGAAMFGPVIGVSCFQAALTDLPSGIVLAIVAANPIIIIPMAFIFEGDRPTRASCLGGLIGVAGVAWICILRNPIS
ncbi:MAG: drug/metabolite transporter (DMT)-like permease [Verrucomicrobiales bacterium]|jgi:drug/metabolite transporter (DMT)-like permease